MVKILHALNMLDHDQGMKISMSFSETFNYASDANECQYLPKVKVTLTPKLTAISITVH